MSLLQPFLHLNSHPSHLQLLYLQFFLVHLLTRVCPLKVHQHLYHLPLLLKTQQQDCLVKELKKVSIYQTSNSNFFLLLPAHVTKNTFNFTGGFFLPKFTPPVKLNVFLVSRKLHTSHKGLSTNYVNIISVKKILKS